MTPHDLADWVPTPLEEMPRITWPSLPLDEWRPTYETLHRWVQIVGKTRLALAPMQNHWWQTALYVTSRGLGTSPLQFEDRTFEVELDFIDHLLMVHDSDAATVAMPLEAQPVAEFHRRYLALLRELDLVVPMRPVPVELPDAIPFTEDRVHVSYDPDAAHRCWHALVQADRVLKEFRGGFLGKSSPVHFWWGSFDLSHTRFSGRRAPTHPGGVPNCPDYVTREAYSHECFSAGWWPGGGAVAEPAFYAYVYPEPRGCAEAPLRAAEAYYHPAMREWILPYEAVRTSPDGDALLHGFLQSTYEAAAELGGWDRAALERPAPFDPRRA